MARSDSRIEKAGKIAADAGQWLRVRTRDGRKFYGIRSTSDKNRVYLVNKMSCECVDFRRSNGEFLCKHVMAVRAHCAVVDAGRAALAIAGESVAA